MSPFLFLAVAAFPILSLAAESVPAPKPPFISAAPEPGDWTLTIKNPAQPPAEPGVAPKPDLRIVEVHSTTSDKVKRDVVTYANGAKDERWFVENFLLWKSADGEVFASDLRDSGPGSTGSNIPSVASGFAGLDWLSLSNYEGVATLDKRTCYHYKFKSMEAWIDVETKLPVASKFGDLYFQYAFNPPPSGPLKFPSEYQATWDLYQQRLNKTEEFQRSLRNNQ